MPDEFTLTVNADDVIARFGDVIPGLVNKNVLEAMCAFMGHLDERVRENIDSMFTKASVGVDPRPQHLHLADSMLATVRQDGDDIIGEYSYDLEETPYARILEMGGHTSPHIITPKSASALKIPTVTLAGGVYEEAHLTDDGLFITTFQVNHPGANITAYHYILMAIVDLSKEFGDDLELAIMKTFVDSER
jgi:hypothetical protein